MTKTTFKIYLTIFVSAFLFACSKNDDAPAETTETTAKFNVFLVDTNKVKSCNSDGTNIKLITQISQGTSKSTYISDMSANPERTKIAYLVRKGDFPNYSTELRIVDFNGNNDKLLVAINDNAAIPGSVKFASGGLVYYNYSIGSSVKFYSIKDDATVNTVKFSHKFEDISNDGRYLLRFSFSLDASKTPIQVLDLSGDGGAGSNKFSKNLDVQLRSMKISSDGFKVAGIYRDGTTVKLLIADVNTGTIEEKTLASNVTNTFGSLFVSFAPDNKTLICTIGGDASKTYIYSLETGTSTSFSNTNKDIVKVYGF
ncbi:MAG: hypothetical protein H7Y07_06810 [Pyrinomonadaceae bacterium]|nr:hypothetical protein [Sphingobacteriaceae bacterium]